MNVSDINLRCDMLYKQDSFLKEDLFLSIIYNICSSLQTWYFDTIHSAVTKLDNVTYGGLHLGCRYVFSSPSERVSGPITEVHVAFFIHHQLITCQSNKELINCQSNQGQSLQYSVSVFSIQYHIGHFRYSEQHDQRQSNFLLCAIQFQVCSVYFKQSL